MVKGIHVFCEVWLEDRGGFFYFGLEVKTLVGFGEGKLL